MTGTKCCQIQTMFLGRWLLQRAGGESEALLRPEHRMSGCAQHTVFGKSLLNKVFSPEDTYPLTCEPLEGRRFRILCNSMNQMEVSAKPPSSSGSPGPWGGNGSAGGGLGRNLALRGRQVLSASPQTSVRKPFCSAVSRHTPLPSATFLPCSKLRRTQCRGSRNSVDANAGHWWEHRQRHSGSCWWDAGLS